MIELPSRGEVTLEGISSVGEDDFIFQGSGGGTPDPDPDPDPGPGTPVVGDPQPNRLHGGPGNDDLDGGDGDDVLYGARGNDVLKGGAGVDSYEGGPGDDVIMVDFFDFTDGKTPEAGADYGNRMMAQYVFDGGENDDGTKDSDTLSFADFTDEDGNGLGVTVTLSGTAGVNYQGAAVTERKFINFENLIGSPFDDDLTGDGGDNVIEGGAGQDTLNPGGGTNNTVSYRHSPSSVTVNLTIDTGGPEGFRGDASGDNFGAAFNHLIGSNHAGDILTGDTNPNVIEGLGGGDTLDGGAGDGDTLSYASSDAGVTIDLNQGDGDFDTTNNTIETASGGHAAGDKVKHGSFSNVTGSAHRDILTGDNDPNILKGGGGNDELNGDGGNDTLNGGPGGDKMDGGNGEDTVTYSDATEGVTVDLSSVSERDGVITIRNGSGRGEARGDTFIDIEDFTGSPHNDTFIAGPKADDIDAGAGADTISYERSTRYAVVVDIANTSAQPGDGSMDVSGRPDTYEPYETRRYTGRLREYYRHQCQFSRHKRKWHQ